MGKKLKDGFYISAYCTIDSLSNILQVTIRHDQNIALWKLQGDKLDLVHHWEIERLSGLKHHKNSFFDMSDFYQYLNELLQWYHLNLNDIEAIVGIEDCEDLKKDSNISYHALCHLYSSLLANTEEFYHEKIISLSFDGGPDPFVENDVYKKAYFAGSYSCNGNVKLFPISSPGRIWVCIRNFLGMEEGSLMALAYASDSESYEEFESFSDTVYFEDFNKAEDEVQKLMARIFSYTAEDAGKKFNFFDERFSEKDNKISMIMKIIQKLSIKQVEKTIDEILKQYQLDPKEVCLSLSGGYSLNCPTNTYLIHKYGFKKQLMIPSTNDGGQAIGIGLKYFYDHLEHLNFELKSSYYGNECKDIPEMDEEFKNKFIESMEYRMDLFADDLIDSPLVWLEGRAEIGPRALGHRSIIADPRTMKSKDILNEVKQRQWWRPVAPIVLEEECEEWFKDSFSSPYMLNNFEVKPEKLDQVPAILHMDHTARVQTIDETAGYLYQGLVKFFQKTGVPIICNTSLNDKGEPIIDSFMQALNFALRKKIKIVYYNGCRIKLKNQNQYDVSKPLQRDDSIFTKYLNREDIFKKINPFNITKEEYRYYTRTPYFQNYDLDNLQDVSKYKKIVKRYREFDHIRKQKISQIIE